MYIYDNTFKTVCIWRFVLFKQKKKKILKNKIQTFMIPIWQYNTENELDDIDKCIYEHICKCEKDIFWNRICIIMYFYCADTTKNNRENCKIKRKKQMGLTKKIYGYTIVIDTK